VTFSPELLAALRSAGLAIEPHSDNAGEWNASTMAEGLCGGDVGPYHSPEEALVGAVRWLVRVADTAVHERDAAIEALVAACEEVEALKRVLLAAQAELRAEREAKGR
jgi:hypothetical protein